MLMEYNVVLNNKEQGQVHVCISNQFITFNFTLIMTLIKKIAYLKQNIYRLGTRVAVVEVLIASNIIVLQFHRYVINYFN